MARARSAISAPSGVSEIPRVVRSNTATPSSCSRSLIETEMLDWEMYIA